MMGGFSTTLRPLVTIVLFAIVIFQLQTILTTAYTIRLHAIKNYGYSKSLYIDLILYCRIVVELYAYDDPY